MKLRPILMSGPMVRAILAGTKTQTRRAVKPQPVNLAGPNFDGVWSDTIDPVTRYFACPYGQPGDRLWVRETWIDTGGWSDNPGDGTNNVGKYVTYVADGAKGDIPVSREIFDEDLSKAIERQRKHCPAEPSDESAPDYWDRYNAYREWISKQYTVQRPSIFMPRWASRITLEVESVRVERLNEISEADALEEGVAEVKDTGLPAGPFYLDYEIGEWKPCPQNEFQGLFRTTRQSYETLWGSINGPKSWAANPWVWVIEFHRIP